MCNSVRVQEFQNLHLHLPDPVSVVSLWPGLHAVLTGGHEKALCRPEDRMICQGMRPGPGSMALALSLAESSDEEAMPPLHAPPVQKRIPSSRESSSSEDSMPPLNQGHEHQDRQSLEHAPDDEPSEASSDDSMPPLHAQLDEGGDNSSDEEPMPPLHGVLRTGRAPADADRSKEIPQPAESAESLQAPLQKRVPSSREGSSSEDSMPPLNQGHEHQDRQSLEHAPDDEPSEASSDDSMPPLHAQLDEGGDNSSDEEPMPPLHGVLRTGRAPADADRSKEIHQPAESAESLQAPLQKRVPSSREGSSSEDSMPPLNQGHEHQDRQSLEHVPDDEPSEASSDDFMPPLHTQLEDQECEDNSSDEESMPPLHGALRTGPEAAQAETSEAMPPVERSESSDGSMPPLDTRDDNTDEEAEAPSYDLHVSAARGRDAPAREAVAGGPAGDLEKAAPIQISPASEQKEPEKPEAPKEETEEAAADAEDAASESGDSLPPLEFLNRAETQLEEDLSIGDFVHLANLKTPGLNGQQGYVVGLPSGTERSERRVEIKMVSGGKTLSVKLSNVLRCAPIAKKPKKPKQSLQKGDEVIVKALTRSVEFNGQRALVIDAQDVDRVTVELRSGQHLSLRRDKLKPVDSCSEEEDSDADRRNHRDKPMPALKSLRQKKEEKEPEELLFKFRVGQKVYLHLKNKPEFHGQAVFVLPSDPLRVDPGMVTVQLATGKRIITKGTHLRPEPPAIQGRKARGRSARRKSP